MRQELVNKVELTIKEKLMNISHTLRNNQGIKQCTGSLVKGDQMCAFGLLGFRAGIPKEELNHTEFGTILEKYGISHKESIDIKLPSREGISDSIRFLYYYNDIVKLSFDQIADVVEEKANSL